MDEVVTVTGGPDIIDLSLAWKRDYLLVAFDVIEIGPSIPAKIKAIEEFTDNHNRYWRIVGVFINHYSQGFYGEYDPNQGVGLFCLT
jgi:hypothetical protein